MAFLTILDSSSKTTPSPKKKTVQSTLAFGNTKASASSKCPKTTAAPKGSGDQSSSPVKTVTSDKNSMDNSFRQFRRICIKLAEEPSYNAKSKILEDFFEKGASGGWCFYAILGTYLIDCVSQ